MALLLVAVVASKPGAGRWHFMPLLPGQYFLLLSLWRRVPTAPSGGRVGPRALVAGTVCALLLLALGGARAFRVMGKSLAQADEARAVIADMQAVRQRHPDVPMAVGYGGIGSYPQTYYRVLPLFDGGPFLVDAAAMSDMQASGFGSPPATLESLSSGAIGLWLVPKGDSPFTLNGYFPDRPIFDRPFRDTFAAHYRKVGSSAYFDLWRFTPGQAVSPAP